MVVVPALPERMTLNTNNVSKNDATNENCQESLRHTYS
ncbi:hypothetical protein AM419_005338 [Klebsiella pneumoniae]|uniref:Uncharacterized protein n=1 Tax=Klebsiella pneumoniae TaxID=573 RepID=A0A378H2C9_KLEPN|nr:hypothetical protein HMPREF1308_05100 [Klebsiella pneumoniae subsp. pneumoniae WGLW5]OKN34094.1 hypothetical protein AM419_005338 [Klebsiella pneumoniae]BBR85935.1 hypothetical protein WP4S18E06_P10960 [Klebsiella quasipneumoniae]OUH91085.1 hypothetical protein AZZ68_004978 [Klebsiella pneumoniae]OUI25373.1 hypothetical protein AZZ76_005018 [Klebsiella pneumoniae]